MQSKKQIFIVYFCDIWKSYQSMKIALITTSPTKVKAFIAKKIKAGDFIWENGGWPRSKQVREFKDGFNKLTKEQINDKLNFTFFKDVYDGEEL